MPASFDETIAYLESRYLTLPLLAEASNVPQERLEALVGAGCLPGHSQEATLSLRVEAVINGSHPADDKRVRYYHPDLALLAIEADKLAGRLGLRAAADTIRARNDAAVAREASFETGSAAHQSMAAEAWKAWRNGTLGVCLQRVSVTNIVRKVLATRRLQAMLAAAAATGPRSVDASQLGDALERYAAVTGPFGPHERHTTTRTLIYEPAVAPREAISREVAAEEAGVAVKMSPAARPAATGWSSRRRRRRGT